MIYRNVTKILFPCDIRQFNNTKLVSTRKRDKKKVIESKAQEYFTSRKLRIDETNMTSSII